MNDQETQINHSALSKDTHYLDVKTAQIINLKHIIQRIFKAQNYIFKLSISPESTMGVIDH